MLNVQYAIAISMLLQYIIGVGCCKKLKPDFKKKTKKQTWGKQQTGEGMVDREGP